MAEDRTAFDIGWDYGMNNLLPAEDVEYPIIAGWHAARDHFGVRATTHDRFVRKWLQLRVNAWRRGRIVDADVTPDFIRYIDTEFCPITRVKLTHGTLTDTDWSVDRLNNNGSYGQYNLVVMSARANHAKGRMNDDDVAAILTQCLEDPSFNRDGLSWEAWLRMLTLLNYITIRENPMTLIDAKILPMAVLPPRNIPVCEWFSLLQLLLYEENFDAIDGIRRKASIDLPGKKLRAKYELLYKTLYGVFGRKIMERRKSEPNSGILIRQSFEDAWLNPYVMKLYTELVEAINISPDFGKFVARLRAVPRGRGRISPVTYVETLHLDTRGYVAA